MDAAQLRTRHSCVSPVIITNFIIKCIIYIQVDDCIDSAANEALLDFLFNFLFGHFNNNRYMR